MGAKTTLSPFGSLLLVGRARPCFFSFFSFVWLERLKRQFSTSSLTNHQIFFFLSTLYAQRRRQVTRQTDSKRQTLQSEKCESSCGRVLEHRDRALPPILFPGTTQPHEDVIVEDSDKTLHTTNTLFWPGNQVTSNHAAMTTTPPPSSAIRTPPTPRYGSRYDNYEPYSPRRSKRIADQQHLFSGSAAALDASTTGLVKEHALRRDQELHQLNISGRATYSPPHSQVGSPKRRSERLDMNSPSLSPPPKNSRIRSEPVSSSVPHFSSSSSSHRSTMDANTNSSLAANGMLPTPAKTPRKKQIEDLGPTARTLFSSSSKSAQDPAAMMPKRSKKYSGFSLESFEADPQQASQEPIAIFTDSRDRIPQVNNSPDNPFRSKPADGEPSSKLSADAGKRRKLDESSRKRDKNVDKAIRRDDGLLYVL